MIKTGRFGAIKYDEVGDASPHNLVQLASTKQWKLSLKTDKINVTCFGDGNKVYVPGLKDVSGSLAGFWNSADLTLFRATDAETPGFLQLIPNENDSIGSPAEIPNFSGLAYLDADIDCSVEGAPAVSGTFVAAGTWTLAPAA
jgi:hypothetical protein